MTTKILYLFTRTPLHVGAGASVGAIDQPVVRERHTGFPHVPGSAIKGVLADHYLDDRSKGGVRTEDGTALFGRQGHEVDKDVPDKGHKSGDISIAEAKLLAFPVRSPKGCFAWVTSPLLLKRWQQATGKTVNYPDGLPAGVQIYGDAATLAENGIVVLEDYALEHQGDFQPGAEFTSAIGDPLWIDLQASHLCLISDDMMAHFAVTACEVAQHVSINDESGTADDGKLFNQENVPAETLFYSVLTELREDAFPKLKIPAILQIGGDATTGLGFCSAQLS
ncbi:MAG: type III-B CRISPR module RAMP protein Cmr4 [Akkermansiaceae bacterium]|nr:type III-B CRISPR module RAMP protein Cmr4 [Akkermansiaceae bacterium]